MTHHAPDPRHTPAVPGRPSLRRRLALALAGALLLSASPFAQHDVGAAPLGWDLAGGDGELTYKDESSYTDDVRRAAEDWNNKGVKVREAKDGETPEVTLRDQQMGPGLGGLTHSHGEIGLNPDSFNSGDANWRQGTIAHELGHAIGLGHDDSRPSVMNSTGTYGGSQNTLTEDDAREGRDLIGSPKDGPPREEKSPGQDPGTTETPSSNHNHPENGSQPTDREDADREDAGGEHSENDPPKISSDDGGKNTATPTRGDRADSYADEDKSPATKGGKGRDYFAEEGSDVFSITDGTVKGSPDGKKVEVEADDDAADGGVRKGDRFRYSNVDGADDVSDGDPVKAGDKIGKVKADAKEKQPQPAAEDDPDGPAKYSHDHFNVRHTDPSGERAEEESSGEMSLAPLLDRDPGPRPGGSAPKTGRSSSCEPTKAAKAPKEKSNAPAHGRGKDRRGGGEDRPTKKKAVPGGGASCPSEPTRERETSSGAPKSPSQNDAATRKEPAMLPEDPAPKEG